MKLSLNWVKKYTDINVSVRELCDKMTMAGFEVEGIEDASAAAQNVVVGKIEKIEKHPDSDHLLICQVNVGSGTVQIVTGASNVFQGALVPAALNDSILPNGTHIKSGKLRGVVSDGMLCSGEELMLSEEEYPGAGVYGILILKDDCTIGDNIMKAVGKDDCIIDFSITPNRPDCQCVLGMAREIAAVLGNEFRLPETQYRSVSQNINGIMQAEVQDSILCPRYMLMGVRNVKIAPSPKWLCDCLISAGLRPINNIVDITNYVMLEYGQPMHAFDFSCVDGGRIVVRTAREGEVIQTLDGNDRKLTPNMLCICDEHKPVCVAGVMGGANSEIVGDTAMVLFESANFNGTSVRRTATALGMRTDASARFEKGLDPQGTLRAVNRACELIELLGCGEVVDGVIDVVPKPIEEKTVLLEPDKINSLLGTDIDKDSMKKILLDLGFTLDGDVIHVPSWRGDVEHYSDIAEEVARFYGYNNIPTRFTGAISTCGGFTPVQQSERRVGELCRAMGLDEIITYSFISPSYYDKIRMPADSPLRDSLRILNPLGEDTSIMRTTILPSMLEILTRNYNYRNRSAALYEIGRIYLKRADGLADEPKIVSMGAYGPEMNFFCIKGWVEELCSGLGIDKLHFAAERENQSYHPGRCAKVWCGETYIGILGQIHPAVAANYGVDAEMYCAELSFDALHSLRGGIPVYKPLPRFPAVTRDIAVVCGAEIPVGDMVDHIMAEGGQYLKGCRIFDVYTGHHIAEGKKSVAFSLTMRADDQTLTDDHAEETVKKVLAALERKFGASIR